MSHSSLASSQQVEPIISEQARHLNYLKFAGMPVPPSQRKRIRINPDDVSSYSPRRVEFMLNIARDVIDGRVGFES